MSLQDLFDSCETYCEPDGAGGYSWSKEGVGFGQFYFYKKDGKLMCSNELMSKEFIKEMLCHMVDSCELDCPRSTDERS